MSMSDSGGFYTIGLTGSSGCIGTAFRDELKKVVTVNGKPVRLIRLVRCEDADIMDISGKDIVLWNPKAQTPEEVMSPNAAASMDAIVHLSGEPIGTGLGLWKYFGIRPWTDAKKKEILDSRTVTTKALASVVAASSTPKTFLVASGVDAYGNHFIGDEIEAVDETAEISTSTCFLTEIVRQWEEASKAAAVGDHRVINMRTGAVLSKMGGALKAFYPSFWLGAGGRLGSGEQYFSFITARDQARAMVHALETPSLSGPVNFCSPQPCKSVEFTTTLGECLGRPTSYVPKSEFVITFVLGEMGKEMLLGGVRCVPKKLLESGFEFKQTTIKEAIGGALEETI